MLQSRSDMNLAAKTIGIECGGYIRWQDLDHDLSLEIQLGRNENARHACTAQLAIDAIAGAEYFL
jgi:hypothetical protein